MLHRYLFVDAQIGINSKAKKVLEDKTVVDVSYTLLSQNNLSFVHWTVVAYIAALLFSYFYKQALERAFSAYFSNISYCQKDFDF